jgi:hypothetical protein
VFAIGGGIAATLLSPIFWLIFPISIATFLWFGFVRFDSDGTFKGT